MERHTEELIYQK